MLKDTTNSKIKPKNSDNIHQIKINTLKKIKYNMLKGLKM